MKNIILALCVFMSTLGVFSQTQDYSCVGFATMNGGTTGGNSATEIIDVSTPQELVDAIGTKKAGGTTPRIIRINGTIDNNGAEISIKECANITIFGADKDAMLSKTPLIITSSSNIIIRNLKFTMLGASGGKDIIEITTTSTNKSQNIWIDHCEFYNETPTVAGANSNSIKDRYDGLLDIKKNSEYITISWCYFHDHYKAILVGFTTNDTYDRKITMHHNRFERINSRIPSFRGGTAHIYNNYFEGWIENGSSQGNCIHTREDCNLLVENNYFTKINRAVYWDPADASEGFASGTGNYFASDVKEGFTSSSAPTPFNPPYDDVNQDMVEDIPTLTLEYAGVGKITSYDDYGTQSDENKAPSVIITSPNEGSTYEAPTNISVSADISDEDGTITKVEFYNNGVLSETLATVPYTYTFVGLTAGNYSFAVKAYDDQNKFTSRSVSVTVNAPSLTEGSSLFGPTAPENDYFWFGENASKINELILDNTISGTATFEANKEVTDYTTHNGAFVLPKSDGSIIFKLPSCTLFKLFLTRTGSYTGNIYVSTDDTNWGTAVTSLSGSKGAKEVDYTEWTTSSSPIYVKIENTSSGSLNIHGADIRLAKSTNSIDINEMNKTLISTKYYNLSGIQVFNLDINSIYIKVSEYDNGTIERIKILNHR